MWCHHLVSHGTQPGDSSEVYFGPAEQPGVCSSKFRDVLVELFFGGRPYADYDLIGPGPGLIPVAVVGEDPYEQGDGDDECQGDGYS